MHVERIMTDLEWIVIIGIFSLTALRSISGQGPLNTAVDVRTPRTYLNCSDSAVPSDQFSWTINNNGIQRNIATGCISTDPQLYEMDSSTPNSCNLIILNAQALQAGLYTCTPGGQPALSAGFVVMETAAVCSSRGNKLNGYTFYCNMTCNTQNFVYFGRSIEWNTQSVVNFAPQSGLRISGSGYCSSVFSTTPGVYAVPSNMCEFRFGAVVNAPTGHATNTPSYASRCNVTELAENKELTYVSMSRNVGILAGGTKVILAITSQGTVDVINNVYFGDTGKSRIHSLERKNMSCMILEVYSPPASVIGKVNVTIQNTIATVSVLNDWYVWSDPTAYFEYKANPTVTKLYPTTHLTSGGTRITIEGTNLDAAESSRLEMNVTIYRNNFTENINATSADCFGIIQDTDPAFTKNKRLLCRMPPLNLPKDFLETLEESIRNADNLSTKRRKRYVNGDFEVARFTNKLEEVAVAELSLVLDGLEPIPIESFTVDFIPISLVTFNKYKDVVRVKTRKPDNIELRGNYINRINADNFVITIGNANCTIQSQHDNLILYLPPKDKPSNGSMHNYTICNGNLLDIQITINQEQHNDTQWDCGCAEYYMYNEFPLLLVVLVTVLGGILIIIISVVLIILCCTKCCKKTNSSDNTTGLSTPRVILRNKSPRTTDNGDLQNMQRSSGDDLNNYNRTMPDESTNDESTNYSRKLNNYNRIIPSIYP